MSAWKTSVLSSSEINSVTEVPNNCFNSSIEISPFPSFMLLISTHHVKSGKSFFHTVSRYCILEVEVSSNKFCEVNGTILIEIKFVNNLNDILFCSFFGTIVVFHISHDKFFSGQGPIGVRIKRYKDISKFSKFILLGKLTSNER